MTMMIMTKTEAFLFLIFVFNYVSSQCIEGKQVSNVTDCTSHSDQTNLCCMISSPGYKPLNNSCIILSANQYFGQNKVFDSTNTSWTLNCGSAEAVFSVGGPCGNKYPYNPYDCWVFSNFHYSCCYYLPNGTAIPACQWFGEKVGANKTTESGERLTCSSLSPALVLGFEMILIILLIF